MGHTSPNQLQQRKMQCHSAALHMLVRYYSISRRISVLTSELNNSDFDREHASLRRNKEGHVPPLPSLGSVYVNNKNRLPTCLGITVSYNYVYSRRAKSLPGYESQNIYLYTCMHMHENKPYMCNAKATCAMLRLHIL